MKKALLATFAAALIASVAVPAMAAQRDDGPRQGPRFVRMMERFDANRDGTVSMDEVAAHRLAMFESADTDKSGSLSKDELKAFGEMRKDMRDQNRDDRRQAASAAPTGSARAEPPTTSATATAAHSSIRIRHPPHRTRRRADYM